MIIRSILAAAFVLVSGVAVIAQSPDLSDIRVDVGYLASDELEGRAAGSEGEILASDYIASRFEQLGLLPRGVDDGWFQPFTFKYHSSPHDTLGVSSSGRNVVGLLDNGSSQTVVVGAHFDHLGWGGQGSRSPNDSLIHNGADDNASGIATLLEIAKQLGASSIRQNVLFIAFSAEERGLIGSKYFASNPTIDLDNVNYMINLDMVGRLRNDRSLVVGGAGTSPTWIPTLDEIGGETFHLKYDSSGIGPSDHTSFYLKDIPVLHFFTGQHREYHKPSDDSHLINYEGIHEIASFAAAIIMKTDVDKPLTFTKTRDKSQGRTAAAFKVSLGVMPDYGWEGEGLRVDAVLDDRPAFRGGLMDGDVIVRIGDSTVKDIYSYMEALGKFDVGDETTVVVTRNDEELETTITF